MEHTQGADMARAEGSRATVMATSSPIVRHFHHPPTSTLTYVVHDEASRAGLVIDSVRHYDPKSGRTRWDACEEVAAYVDHLVDQGVGVPVHEGGVEGVHLDAATEEHDLAVVSLLS